MSRKAPWARGAVIFLALVVHLGCSTEDGRAAAGAPLSQRNLILITIDTLRADRLGAYGFAGARTPNLDSLAEDGVRFEHCYSSVPLTLPAHASLFTGRYPFATGVRLNGVHELEASATTLAEILEARDFSTYAVVGAFVLGSKFGLGQGFQEYDDSLAMDELFRFYSEIPADQVADRFLNWLKRRPDGRFFAWLHFYDPHLPYDPPPEYGRQFPDDPYSGEVSFVDSQIGEIMAELGAQDLLARSLIVVTSDHGDAFGEHGEEGHGLLTYDETLRVPLIFQAEGGLPGGRVVPQRVGLIDLFPTLLSLLSIPVPENSQGRSLEALLRGEAGDGDRDPLYFEALAGYEVKSWAPLSGIIAEDLKLISVPEPELYDLRRDPGETRNLAGSRPEVVGALQEQLDTMAPARVPAPGGGSRELDQEERRHLAALGYISSPAVVEGARIDPKRGIAIEMEVRGIRGELNAGRVDAAEDRLEALVAANPGYLMADIFEVRQEIEAKRGRVDAALQALAEGIEAFPRLDALLLRRARYFYDLGRVAEAEVACQEILEGNPELTQAWSLEGLLAESKADWASALTSHSRALELAPRSVPLRAKVADMHVQLGHFEEAGAILDELAADGALDSRPEKIYQAAVLQLQAGDAERGEALFRRGLELSPAGTHHLGFALLLSQRQKNDEARRHVQIALEEYGDELTSEQRAMATALAKQLENTE